jgi:hypothetical protein
VVARQRRRRVGTHAGLVEVEVEEDAVQRHPALGSEIRLHGRRLDHHHALLQHVRLEHAAIPLRPAAIAVAHQVERGVDVAGGARQPGQQLALLLLVFAKGRALGDHVIEVAPAAGFPLALEQALETWFAGTPGSGSAGSTRKTPTR